MIKIRNLILIAVLWPGFASDLGAQGTIQIKLTDKSGGPRSSLNLVYDVRGIVVENPSATPVDLIRNQSDTTDPNGVFKIDVANLRSLIAANSSALLGSEQVRIEISPLSTGRPLAPIQLEFLLGSVTQDLSVVMMSLTVYKSIEIGRAAYTGNSGTFHLAGNSGTALICLDHYSKPFLTELEFQQSDENYFVYRDVDLPDTYWAFAKKVFANSCCRGHAVQQRFKIWVHRPGSKGWVHFQMADRIEPANANAFMPLPAAGSAAAESMAKKSEAIVAGMPYRTWHDSSGRFSTTAQLLGFRGTAVRLKLMSSGSVVEVPYYQLSVADQEYIKDATSEPQN